MGMLASDTDCPGEGGLVLEVVVVSDLDLVKLVLLNLLVCLLDFGHSCIVDLL